MSIRAELLPFRGSFRLGGRAAMAGPVAGLALVENGRSWYRYN